MSAVHDAPSRSGESVKFHPAPGKRPPLPASPGRTLGVLAVALLGSIGLTVWLTSGESAAFLGSLQAHVTPVTVDRDVRLKEILVEEGTPVQPGQPIARLLDETLISQREDQKARLGRLEEELAQLEAEAEVEIAWRTQEIESQMLQAQLQQASSLKIRLDREVESHAWGDVASGAVPDWGPVSANDVFRPASFVETLPGTLNVDALLRRQAARNAAEVAAVRAELCETRIRTLERLKTELPEKVRQSLGIPQMRSEVARAEDRLNRLENQPTEIPLKATGHGTVGVFRKQVGDPGQSGDVIVELLDQDRRFVTVRIPSRRMADLPAKGEVTLRFPAGETRTGRIEHVPPQTVGTMDGMGTGGGGDASLRLRIRPAGKVWPKSPIGTAVEVLLDG